MSALIESVTPKSTGGCVSIDESTGFLVESTGFLVLSIGFEGVSIGFLAVSAGFGYGLIVDSFLHANTHKAKTEIIRRPRISVG